MFYNIVLHPMFYKFRNILVLCFFLRFKEKFVVLLELEFQFLNYGSRTHSSLWLWLSFNLYSFASAKWWENSFYVPVVNIILKLWQKRKPYAQLPFGIKSLHSSFMFWEILLCSIIGIIDVCFPPNIFPWTLFFIYVFKKLLLYIFNLNQTSKKPSRFLAKYTLLLYFKFKPGTFHNVKQIKF